MENTEYEANWEGNAQASFEKTIVPEDSYNGIVKDISIIETADFEDKNKKIEKIVISLEITDDSEKGKVLAHFLRPYISKAGAGGKGYSNSKLYDLLESLNLKEKAKADLGNKYSSQKILDWLLRELLEKKVRFSTSTSKDKSNSYVKKIIRFV